MASRDRTIGVSAPDFRALFQVLPEPLVVVAPPHWTIVAANDARLALTGGTLEDQIGRRLFDVHPEDPRDPSADGMRRLAGSFERVVATGASDALAVQRYVVPDAEGRFVERWWSALNAPVLDGRRQVAFIIHLVEDVTEIARPRGGAAGPNGSAEVQRVVIDRLRASEAALRETEARFRNMADHAPVMMWVTDPTGHCTYLNRAWYDFTGQTAAEAEGFGWLDATHPDDKRAADEAFRAANAARAPFRLEYRLRRADGAYRWAIDAASPRFGADGGFLGYVGSVIDIDERREAEDRLRESEARFRLMADAAPQIMWITDAQGRVEFFNKQWSDYTGVPYEPTTAAAVAADHVHPEDADATMAAFAEALRTEADFAVEHRIRSAAGGHRWFLVRAAPHRDPVTGEIVRWFGASTDIHDRKLAEQALAASRATLRAVYDNMSAALVVAELPSGRLIEANRAFEEIFRYPMRRVGGVDEYDLFEAYDADGRRVAGHEYPLARTAATGEPADGTYRFARGDGTRAWLRVQTAAIRDASGAITGGVAAITDVDEMVRTREALERLTANLEAEVAERATELDRVWRTSPDLLLVLDFDGVFRRVNPAWTAILGWEERELIGTRVDRLVHPDDVELTEQALAEAAGGLLPMVENRYRHKDGSYRWLSWITAPPENGTIYATARHVTAEKERQLELEAAQEALRQSQKMEAMGSLTGGVAHDFNNLLTPIIGSLDMLARKGLGGERERRLIDGALQSAERAKTLVQRLLAFARRQPLRPVAVDLGRLVPGMVDLLGSTLGPVIAVRVDLAPDLPPALADPNQLEMALLNLAVNARDAMPDGGTLTVSARRARVRTERPSGLKPGRYIRLAVADTGEGMDEETRRRAIEPFFSTKGVGKGTGLGLSMVHGLAAQLGGAMTIDTAPGRGTTVELWLPVGARPADGGQEAEAAAPPGPARRGLALLVDDEDLVRTSTADMLLDLGFEVVEAGSAEDALRLLRSGAAPDLLVTDHLMPGMNGSELARKARAIRPDLPVLVVSGYAETDGIAPELPRLAKPFRSAELDASLSALVSEARH